MGVLLEEKRLGCVETALSVLPKRLSREIERLAIGRAEGYFGIREIRLRVGGVGSLLYKNEALMLSSITRDELSDVFLRLCDGCVFAHRDTIADGFISLDHGVRVGIGGSCKYEGGRIVGIGDISSLVFRLPTGVCEFGEELFTLYMRHLPRGLIIYSPPGVGKTTALRYLAKRLGMGPAARNVVVIDERCEFSAEDYKSSRVDILRGYKKRLGIEIAIRSLSSETVIADELGGDDVSAILDVIRFGVPFIATSHAGSLDELMKKPQLRPLFDIGAIDMLIGIRKDGDKYILSHELPC